MAFGVFRSWPGGGAVSAGPSPSQVWVLGVYWDRFRNGRVSGAERRPITTLLYLSTLSDNDGLTKGMNFVCHDQWIFRGVPRKRCLSGKDGAGVDDRRRELGAGN